MNTNMTRFSKIFASLCFGRFNDRNTVSIHWQMKSTLRLLNKVDFCCKKSRFSPFPRNWGRGRLCIMPRLPRHLVQELNARTVEFKFPMIRRNEI